MTFILMKNTMKGGVSVLLNLHLEGDCLALLVATAVGSALDEEGASAGASAGATAGVSTATVEEPTTSS